MCCRNQYGVSGNCFLHECFPNLTNFMGIGFFAHAACLGGDTTRGLDVVRKAAHVRPLAAWQQSLGCNDPLDFVRSVRRRQEMAAHESGHLELR